MRRDETCPHDDALCDVKLVIVCRKAHTHMMMTIMVIIITFVMV